MNKIIISTLTLFCSINLIFGQTENDLDYLIQINKIEQFESAFSQLTPNQIKDFLGTELVEDIAKFDYEKILMLKEKYNDSITVLTFNNELTAKLKNKLIGHITLNQVKDSLYPKLKDYINKNNIKFTRLYETYNRDSLVYSENIKKMYSFAFFADDVINTYDFTDQYKRTEFISKKFGPLGGFGIDVSHHQGTINWNKVYNDTIPKRLDFVMLKATDGATWPNRPIKKEIEARMLFDNNVKWLSKEKKFKVGAYHFFQPVSSTPEAQAKNFINRIKDLDLEILPIVDAEKIPKCTNCKGKRDYASNLDKFISILEEYFNTPIIIYTYDNFYLENLQGKLSLKNRYLWLARYYSKGLFYGSSKKPTIFDKSRIIGWQYAESGTVDGIKSIPKCKIWYTKNSDGSTKKHSKGVCVDLNFIYYKNYDKWLNKKE